MVTSTVDSKAHPAVGVEVAADALAATLADGRSIVVPLAWFPRLLHATPEERSNWRLIGGGLGIHWPDLDEDVSVEGMLAGRPSGEGEQSFQRWLQAKRAGAGATLPEIAERGKPGA